MEQRLIGNRIALVGTIMYLLEWAGIVALSTSLPTDRLGRDAAATLADYAQKPGTTALVAGWFGVVLLGRVVFMVGLKSALRTSRPSVPLAEIAVAAMAVSVAIEVVSFGLSGAAAWMADAGADAGAVAGLDAAGAVLFAVIFGPLGGSVVAGALAMLVSRGFPRWLGWLGLVAGSLIAVAGVLGPAALGDDGAFHDVGTAFTGLPVLGLWVWMIVASIVVWRAPRAVTD